LGGGAEQGEAGDEFERVGATTHQVFERTAAGELLADGAGDFFVAGADPPSLKLPSSLKLRRDKPAWRGESGLPSRSLGVGWSNGRAFKR
jgi:hypothetical protein